MNKLITILIGFFMIYIGISAVVTGETTGFSAGNTAGYPVFYDTDPIAYTLNTILAFGIGIWLLKTGLFGKIDVENTPADKPRANDLAPKRR